MKMISYQTVLCPVGTDIVEFMNKQGQTGWIPALEIETTPKGVVFLMYREH